MSKRWNYCGGVDLMNGGYFWREDGAEDYVLCVRITACADAGGPDNMVWIESGSIYLPQVADKQKAALSCCGYDLDESGNIIDGSGGVHAKDSKTHRLLMINAFMAYAGLDKDAGTIVRVGPPDAFYNGRENIEPDTVLRSNANLKNWIKRQGWLS